MPPVIGSIARRSCFLSSKHQVPNGSDVAAARLRLRSPVAASCEALSGLTGKSIVSICMRRDGEISGPVPQAAIAANVYASETQVRPERAFRTFANNHGGP